MPRELFVAPAVARQGLEWVYDDRAIVTERDARGRPTSSSSQPSIMAVMLEQLDVRPGQRVLEVGAGSGYNAALLATLVGVGGLVVSVELDEEVARSARAALARGGYPVQVVTADGWHGWAGHAPFDRIIVTASTDDVAGAWFDQLAVDGRLVLPLRRHAALCAVWSTRAAAFSAGGAARVDRAAGLACSAGGPARRGHLCRAPATEPRASAAQGRGHDRRAVASAAGPSAPRTIGIQALTTGVMSGLEEGNDIGSAPRTGWAAWPLATAS